MCQHIDFKRLGPVAAQQMQRKMRLEDKIKGPLRSYFRRIVKDFRIAFASSGRPVNMGNYAGELEVILRRHYERVQREFRDDIGRQNGGKSLLIYAMKQTADEQQNVDLLLDVSLLAWITETLTRKVEFIGITNDLQMMHAIDLARQSLIDSGEPLDNRNVAITAAALLIRMYESRVDRIAVSETQEAAESTNQIHASILAGAIPFSAVGVPGVTPAVEEREVNKTWRDMDDGRVRATHRRVDGTTLPENGIFIVGGSRLRFPGDASLGAAIGEIINCRCFSDYRIAT